MTRWQKLVTVGVAAARLTIAASAFVDPPSLAAADDKASPNSLRISLSEAQNLAFEKNWDLLAAAAGVDIATAQKVVAREFPNPTLSLSTSKINVDHHPNSTPWGNGVWERSYDTIIAINQLFEIGGKRRNRKLSAAAGYDAARAQYLDARRTLGLAVAKAYVAATFGSENALVLRRSAATLRKEAEVAEARLKAGEISDSDKNQIDITASRFELDANAAESAAAQARIALEILLGLTHPRGDTVLTDQLETLASAPLPNLATTGAMRPDVLAAEAELRKSETDLALQKANRIPDPTLLTQYEHEPPDAPNSVGFGISIPIPIWNRNTGNILAARGAREQARLAYDKARAQAVAEIAGARLAYEDASRRWQLYRDAIRKQSEKVVNTLSYAYGRGGASLLDMLIAERNDNEVRLAAMQAASDTATALATLRAATQEIQPSDLKK